MKYAMWVPKMCKCVLQYSEKYCGIVGKLKWGSRSVAPPEGEDLEPSNASTAACQEGLAQDPQD